MCGGLAFSLSHTILLVGETSFLLIMHRSYVYATIADYEGCIGFIVEKGPLLSNVAGVSGLWSGLLFLRDPCYGFLLCVSSTFCFGLCLFPLMHRLRIGSFPICRLRIILLFL